MLKIFSGLYLDNAYFSFFSYSGLTGILGSDEKQNTAYAGARGCENCCTFH